MSGWKRLWVLISIIWALIIIAISAIVIKDTYNIPNGPLIIYRLSYKSKVFYQDLEEDEKGPAYTVTFKYEDGTTQSVRCPLFVKPIEDIDFSEHLRKMALESGKKISDHEIELFISNVSKKNSSANSAKAEYESEREKVQKENIESRKNTFLFSTIAIIVPPIVILLIGYGVAWVRKGFK